MNIGSIERSIYTQRSKHPLIIPQIDPSTKGPELIDFLKGTASLGVEFIAIGGTIVSPKELEETINLATDSNLKCLIYPTNSAAFTISGKKGWTAYYWMHIPNALNQFFQGDILIQNSMAAISTQNEFIPTAYVFDDRGSVESSMWLSRANPIPRNKSYLSLAVALASELSGSRFYIMAGGSGCKLIPPTEHIALLRKKTNLFLIPTSGIGTPADAKKIFDAGGDAIHIGNALETHKSPLKLLEEFVEVSEEFPGRQFRA